MTETVQVKCHSCQHWLGEAPAAVEFCGVFRDPQDRALIIPPRLTYRCRSCGWVTVFRPVALMREWRTLEVKRAS